MSIADDLIRGHTDAIILARLLQGDGACRIHVNAMSGNVMIRKGLSPTE